jgi:hypothetical protein
VGVDALPHPTAQMLLELRKSSTDQILLELRKTGRLTFRAWRTTSSKRRRLTYRERID